MLVNMRHVAVFRQAEHSQAVVPVAAGDQQLRVVSEDKNAMVDLQVWIKRASNRFFRSRKLKM
jgi:hypothetical protein